MNRTGGTRWGQFVVELLLDVLQVDALPHRELIAEAAVRVEDEDGGGGRGREVAVPGLLVVVVFW